MRIKWSVAILAIGIATGALGCGSYGSSNSPMTAPDSSSDSMPRPPGY